MAEREGKSSLKTVFSTTLFFHLYLTQTIEDFPEYVRDERYSLKQESDTLSYPCNIYLNYYCELFVDFLQDKILFNENSVKILDYVLNYFTMWIRIPLRDSQKMVSKSGRNFKHHLEYKDG